MSFTDDLKEIRANQQVDGSVVAPVKPKQLNEKQTDLVNPAGPPLSQQDLKVTKPAEQPVDPVAIKSQLTLDDASVVDMSSLTVPIGSAEQPIPTEASSPAGDAPTEKSPPEELSPAKEPETVIPVAPTYKVGNKEFKTAEELLAYANGLAQNGSVDFSSILDTMKLAPPEPADPNAADVWFDDPNLAAELLKKQVKAEIQAELRMRDEIVAARESKAKAWKDFYTANSDLVGFEDIVQKQVDSLDPKLSVENGLKMAAEKSRARISDLRKKLTPTEVVAARVITPSANKVETPQAPKSVSKPTSFIDELKNNARSKRGA